MGRKSKLTEAQWAEVRQRVLAGESARAVGAEFGITEAGIRKRLGANQSVSAQSAQVRTVAEKLADAQRALQDLPPVQRPVAESLAETLRRISTSLASAGELGAKTAHRLQHLANTEVNKVDGHDPLQSVDVLKGVSALTRLANDSSHIALNLLAANKERVKAMDDGPTDAAPELAITVTRVHDAVKVGR
jgi:glutamine synthetase adenylyltransferase